MKFFVISDVHGFYTEMKRALDEAGFDPSNEDHWLISCGDNFDRGGEPEKVLEYLSGLPRKTLVRGNHEDLLMECCEWEEPSSRDYHNGTYDTICELGGAGEGRPYEDCCTRTLARVGVFIDSMVNYFETKNYVFTHGYVPLVEDWRNASELAWESARWANGMNHVHNGRTIDKCVVVGHWHTSWGRSEYEGKPEFVGADFSPYYMGEHLIAIDACTAYSHRVNVLVLEDEFL